MPIDGRFTSCLYEPEDLVEIRLVRRRGEDTPQLYERAGQLTDLADEIQQANAAGRNIYIGANPRCRKSGTDKDVALARCVFADIDRVTVDAALDRIAQSPMPKPTITIASGHGVHAYWRFVEPTLDLVGWTRAQKQLIALLHSDKVIHNPSRVMRLPAFTNHKPPRAESRVIEADPNRRYGQSDILARIGCRESETREDVSERTETPETMTSEVSDLSDLSDTCEPDEILTFCIPSQHGERNACIMRLARGLKLDAGLRDWPLSRVRPIVKAWHKLALPYIGTQPFDESWCDFIRAWQCARIPLRSVPVDAALASARQQLSEGNLPGCAGEYESEGVRLLVAMCAALAALHPERHFFLSSHHAGRLLGVAQAQAYRWIRMLVADKVLAVIKPGDEYKATRYRFIGGDAEGGKP